MLRNRAAAHEKLQKWSAVEADASAALKADAAAGEPVSAKALLRRAAALVQLSRPEDAITAADGLALKPPERRCDRRRRGAREAAAASELRRSRR